MDHTIYKCPDIQFSLILPYSDETSVTVIRVKLEATGEDADVRVFYNDGGPCRNVSVEDETASFHRVKFDVHEAL